MQEFLLQGVRWLPFVELFTFVQHRHFSVENRKCSINLSQKWRSRKGKSSLYLEDFIKAFLTKFLHLLILLFEDLLHLKSFPNSWGGWELLLSFVTFQPQLSPLASLSPSPSEKAKKKKRCFLLEFHFPTTQRKGSGVPKL